MARKRSSCERNEPDVIVMDMKLPGIDGVDTTAKIRRAQPPCRWWLL